MIWLSGILLVGIDTIPLEGMEFIIGVFIDYGLIIGLLSDKAMFSSLS